MSINSAARRDAYKDFYPGAEQPATYRYAHTYYRGCYDLAWRDLQKQAEKEAEREPTTEERVATLGEQVAELTRRLES